MKIKKGDNVKMLAGKDKGKQGKVLLVNVEEAKVVVEGLNIYKKSRRPKRAGEKGQIISFPRAITVSNVTLVCPNCGKSARVGHFIGPDGKKLRRCVKCQASFI